eukprot:m.18638 g.18638  ORF g.18638 m.18638 type:complete len:346 (+) comp7922_c0_seq3:121-1158(+)
MMRGRDQWCEFNTRNDCIASSDTSMPCDKLHFEAVKGPSCKPELGDCPFLDTCHRIDTCKRVHYRQYPSSVQDNGAVETEGKKRKDTRAQSQWIQCDVTRFDFSSLGMFFDVVVADPPWQIKTQMAYGLMADTSISKLPMECLQQNGFLFLWVTTRTMDFGRSLLQRWGYQVVDDIVWVKLNQVGRLIETGRTGYWLNHSKEHCLVGRKGKVEMALGHLECDVIVSKVRAASQKPDEFYNMVDRLFPSGHKLELFGRQHNTRPGWLTLGDQLQGVHLVDEELQQRYVEQFAKHISQSSSTHVQTERTEAEVMQPQLDCATASHQDGVTRSKRGKRKRKKHINIVP